MTKLYASQMHMFTDAQSAPACHSACASSAAEISLLDAALLAASFLFTLLGLRIMELVVILYPFVAKP